MYLECGYNEADLSIWGLAERQYHESEISVESVYKHLLSYS